MNAALPWIGVVTLAIIGIIFWMELSGPSAPPAPPVVAMAQPPTTAEAPVTPPPSATIADPAPSAATIELDRPVAAAPAVVAKKPVAPPDDAATKKPAAPQLASAAPALPAQRSPFAVIDKPAAPGRPVAPAATPSRKPKSGDRDADIVAALMSHSAAGAPVVSVAKQEPVATSRDVVERDPVISTDKLLKRCDSLGVLEAELCKARICSGLWGKDSSCPARAPVAQPAVPAQTGN